MGFQGKIFLLMLGTMVAILVPTLLLVDSRLRENAEESISKEFETQVQVVASERAQRLENFSNAALELAKNPRVRKAITETLSETEKRAFLTEAVALRKGTNDRPESARPAASKARGAARRLPGGRSAPPLFCTVDLEGGMQELTSSRGANGSHRRAIRLRRENLLERLRDLKRSDFQQVGYMVVPRGPQDHSLQEVIVTSVREGEELVGMFIMGVDAETQIDHLFNRLERATEGESGSGGFFVGGRVIQLRGLQDVDRDQVNETVAKHLEGAQGAAEVELGGAPYRLIWKEMNPDSILPSAHQIAFFPLAGIRAEIRSLELKILILGLVAVAFAGLASFWISRSLARPVKVLERATVQVGEGNFDVRVEIKSKDELGRLGESFNQMTEGLALKERYREVLSKVSDETVAQALIHGQLELGGETRFLTVLFCDIRGFTSLTESMNPQEVISFLNVHMTAMTEIVYAHKGVVDKFVGDEIMAVFGAPKEYGDDPANAVRCALAMIAKRAELNWTADYPIEIGIGVASGEMVAGCMGSLDRLNYTVLGEPVNLGARLCGKAVPGEVLAAVPAGIALGEALELDAKGYRGRVKAVRVSGVGRAAVAPRAGDPPEEEQESAPAPAHKHKRDKG